MDGFVAYLQTHDTGLSALLLWFFNNFTTSPATWNKTLILFVNFPAFIIGSIFTFKMIMGIKKNFFDDPKKNGGDYSFSKEDYWRVFGNGAVAAFIFVPSLISMFFPVFRPFVNGG